MRRGHQPVAYSTKLGQAADELRAATVPVIDRLDSLGTPPDIIHGHHHYETLTALLRFPETPAIYYCHGWLPWQEAPLRAPQIRRYVAVDAVCRERLITEGIAPDKIEVLLNFFDQRRFPPRPGLPGHPRRAIAFGHSFSEQADLPQLREACARCGIELEAAGLLTDKLENHPGQRLAEYDIVFARGRAAIEAMAVGAAVILCSYGKLGPLVTAENFAALRTLNFGLRTLSRELDVELTVAELRRYNPEDAAAVSRLTRDSCELQGAVDRLVELYSRVIETAKRGPVPSTSEQGAAAARYLEHWSGQYKLGPEILASGPPKVDRSAAAEAVLEQEAQRLRVALEERCAAAERSLNEARAAAGNLEREKSSLAQRLRAAESELWEMRNSATWRWTQSTLQHPAAQAIFGRWTRAVAERSKRRPGAAPPDPAGQRLGNLQSRAEEMIARHGFLGVPLETFEAAGRSQLSVLLNEGLKPESNVLEFGCGCLRIGYWLIRFLDPGRYHGIEPARQRVEYGLQYLFSPEEAELKRPRFDQNANFDSAVFHTKFDFFIARSIWTHAAKFQIEATLDSFLRDMTPESVFLASYLPADSNADDYQGDRWVGTSHKSDVPGVVRHSLTWIKQQCETRGLQVTELPGFDCDSQLWLRIRRA